MIRRSVLTSLSLSCWFSCWVACSDAGDPGHGALNEAELSARRSAANAGAPGRAPEGAADVAGVPRTVEGNPSSCSAVIPEAANLLTFKVDPAKTGTYTSGDGGVTIVIDASEKSFSFKSDIPLAWVVVKGGPGANIYRFDPPVMSAEGLVAPDGKGLSHLDFCYPPPGGGEGGSTGSGSGGASSSGGTDSSGGTSTGGAMTAGSAGEGTGGCDGPCQR